MSKIIAATRIGSEEDIAEAFVRHTSKIADHHILLIDGSTDRTQHILANLEREGLPISFIKYSKVHFDETDLYNTLYRKAIGAGASWVFFLDSDEFLDTRRLPRSVREYFSEISSEEPDVCSVRIPVVDYFPTSLDDASDPNVATRIRRHRKPTGNDKVFVSSNLADFKVEMQPGGHDVLVDGGRRVTCRAEPSLSLAHYPERSVYQWLAKAIVGWAKVLAAGDDVVRQGRSFHYKGAFQAFLENPAAILNNEEFMHFRHQSEELVDDPINYLGENLLYTHSVDYSMAAIKTVMNYISRLSTQHGRLVERNEAVRALLEKWNMGT